LCDQICYANVLCLTHQLVAVQIICNDPPTHRLTAPCYALRHEKTCKVQPWKIIGEMYVEGEKDERMDNDDEDEHGNCPLATIHR
jgi:hypothetical protein